MQTTDNQQTDPGVFSKRDIRILQSRLWRERNPDKVRARDKARYWADRDEWLAKSTAWQKRNASKANANNAAYKARHRERLRAERIAKRLADPEPFRAAERRKFNAKPHVYRAKRNARDKRQREATPVWADRAEIKRIYELAAWLGMQVDHIHPLKGRNFCGLHVPWNLQLLTATENAAKGNRLQDT